MRRLEDAERAETNPHFCDDYRISWIATLYAARSEPQPHVRATYAVLGIHPDKVFAAITARRQAKLGPEYDKFYGDAQEPSPKKPAQSVRLSNQDVA